MRQITARITLVIIWIALSLPAAQSAQAGDPPCTTLPGNMTRNGSVTDGGYPTQYGTVANEWNPFIYGGTPPAYDLADNESANGDIPGSSSQYIHGDGVQFDAGIYQTITGTQPGEYYQFSIGWAPMLRDTGGGNNKKMDNVIARLVGVDPTGGTDPHSPNVTWGPELWTGSSGQSLNSPTMQLVFAALSDHVTVFARAYDTSSSASDKAWFDVICLMPRTDLPTATPAATATSTPTATAPAPTVRPAAIALAPKAPTAAPTDVPTEAPTNAPTNAPTITITPSPTSPPTGTPRPRRPIPMATGGGTTEESAGFLPLALLLSSLGVIGFTLFGMFCLAAFLVWRIFVNRPAPSFAPPPPRFPRYQGTTPRSDATKPRLPPEDQLRGGIY